MKDKRKIVQLLVLVVIGIIPLGFTVGCGVEQYSCSACGSVKTYTPFYAKGVEEGTNVEYESCVGPAGCIGFGCGTSCVPTECIKVKYAGSDGKEVSGCVKYFDEFGCINGDTAKSEGQYNADSKIGCITCVGDVYTEDVKSDGVSAYEGSTCLGISCGRKSPTNNRNYNQSIPRQFPRGCYTGCFD